MQICSIVFVCLSLTCAYCTVSIDKVKEAFTMALRQQISISLNTAMWRGFPWEMSQTAERGHSFERFLKVGGPLFGAAEKNSSNTPRRRFPRLPRDYCGRSCHRAGTTSQ